MTDLIVQPVVIENVRPHPNADRLEIATIGGYDIVLGKDNHVAGDIVIHVPPDAMVPRPLAIEWGVDPYLSWKGQVDDEAKGRVKAARLRGVVSYGFIAPNESNAPLGADLREHYGIEKWEPPTSGMPAGQVRECHPLFHRYSDIKNLRNFPKKPCYDRPIVVTEKIHGTNSRVGWVRPVGESEGELERVVGTHRTQRDLKDCGIYGLPFEQYGTELDQLLEFAKPLTPPGETLNSVIVFGEIYGEGIQKGLTYGQKAKKGYRVFDVSINGRYVPFVVLKYICGKCDIPVVPVLFSGVTTFDEILEMAEGETMLDDDHIREGVVIRPLDEESTWDKGKLHQNPNEPLVMLHERRMIFKVVSGTYLTTNGMTDFH